MITGLKLVTPEAGVTHGVTLYVTYGEMTSAGMARDKGFKWP